MEPRSSHGENGAFGSDSDPTLQMLFACCVRVSSCVTAAPGQQSISSFRRTRTLSGALIPSLTRLLLIETTVT